MLNSLRTVHYEDVAVYQLAQLEVAAGDRVEWRLTSECEPIVEVARRVVLQFYRATLLYPTQVRVAPLHLPLAPVSAQLSFVVERPDADFASFPDGRPVPVIGDSTLDPHTAVAEFSLSDAHLEHLINRILDLEEVTHAATIHVAVA